MIQKILEFYKEIGGRYSIWSDISMPALCGNQSIFDSSDFLKGGRQADLDLENDDDYIKFIKYLSFSDIWMNNYLDISGNPTILLILNPEGIKNNSWKKIGSFVPCGISSGYFRNKSM